MSSQQPTPLSALDALEQHTPRRVVRTTLRALTLVTDEDVARWEDDDGAFRLVGPSILEQALEAAIAERIGEHLEQGSEHLARRFYGEQAVDRVIAEDVAQLRDGTLDQINGYVVLAA